MWSEDMYTNTLKGIATGNPKSTVSWAHILNAPKELFNWTDLLEGIKLRELLRLKKIEVDMLLDFWKGQQDRRVLPLPQGACRACLHTLGPSCSLCPWRGRAMHSWPWLMHLTHASTFTCSFFPLPVWALRSLSASSNNNKQIRIS